MKDIQALKDYLSTGSKKITIVTHANPDADAMGSALGFYLFLNNLNHEVKVIVPNQFPDFLKWMPSIENVIIYDNAVGKADNFLETTNLLCCLDFSSLNRIYSMQNKIENLSSKVLLIDHHLNPAITPDFSFWDKNAAATAQLVYRIICAYGSKSDISAEIAECLYAGIMTDTGSFKHSCTTAEVHRIVADLIDLGANTSKISQLIYDNNSVDRLRFLGYALANKLVVNKEYNTAYLVLSQEDRSNFKLKTGDTEGLVNYALSIKGVEVAAIIIEKEHDIKLSFRSSGDYDVSTFANKFFSGGGHKNAAGGSSSLTLEETENKLNQLIQKNELKTI